MTEYSIIKEQVREMLADLPRESAVYANIAAVLYHGMESVNWAGFYFVTENDLLTLGAFQGKPACVEIPFGKGVCGTAAEKDEILVVPDVHAFSGHIACDADSASEIVLPIHRNESVIGVLDIDSPIPNRFSEDDRAHLSEIVQLIESAVSNIPRYRGSDMIANIANLPEYTVAEGFQIKRVYPTDRERVKACMLAHFSEGWALEADYAMLQDVPKCFIATRNKEICGFACYDATAKGYFGPIGVRDDLRGYGLGKALLLRALHALADEGYGYAIIGWVGSAEHFYRKCVGAEYAPSGTPQRTVYQNMIDL